MHKLLSFIQFVTSREWISVIICWFYFNTVLVISRACVNMCEGTFVWIWWCKIQYAQCGWKTLTHVTMAFQIWESQMKNKLGPCSSGLCVCVPSTLCWLVLLKWLFAFILFIWIAVHNRWWFRTRPLMGFAGPGHLMCPEEPLEGSMWAQEALSTAPQCLVKWMSKCNFWKALFGYASCCTFWEITHFKFQMGDLVSR